MYGLLRFTLPFPECTSPTRPSPPPRLAHIPGLSQIIPHRFLQVVPRELAVLGVMIKHRTELKVSSSFDPLRGLELKNSLQTMDAQANLRGTWSTEMLSESKQGEVPRFRGLAARRHFADNNNNKHLLQPRGISPTTTRIYVSRMAFREM